MEWQYRGGDTRLLKKPIFFFVGDEQPPPPQNEGRNGEFVLDEKRGKALGGLTAVKS